MAKKRSLFLPLFWSAKKSLPPLPPANSLLFLFLGQLLLDTQAMGFAKKSENFPAIDANKYLTRINVQQEQGNCMLQGRPKIKGRFPNCLSRFLAVRQPSILLLVFSLLPFFGIWSVPPPLWDFGTTVRDQKRRRTKGWTWREEEGGREGGTYCPPPKKIKA